MRKLLLYGTVAVISFLAFVVVYAPASVAWSLAREDVNRTVPDLQVLTIAGSVWSGNASLRFREFPPAGLSWSVSPAFANGMAADLDISLGGDGLSAAGSGTVTRNFVVVDAAGYVDSQYINPVSRRYGLSFPGRIDISGLSLESDLGWFTAAKGTARWDGGTVEMETQGRRTMTVTLPPLEGALSLNGRDLLLDVTEQGETVMQVTLKPTGWAVVDIKTRLLQVAGLPFREDSGPETSAVIAEEKLF